MPKPATLAAARMLLLYSPSALAWDGLGHEAICELAFRELDDTARQRVVALIQLDDEFPTFRASCNWPDRPRQRASEHFVNLPRDAAGLDGDQCPLAEKCVVSANRDDFAVLASPDTSDEEKAGGAQVPGPLGRQHSPARARRVPGRQGAITSGRGAARARVCIRSGIVALSGSGSALG